MSAEGKPKISFGFSKLSKPKVAIITNNKDIKSDEKIQFIDCVEEKSIKVKNEEPKQPEFLVIPLPKTDGIIGRKNSDILNKVLHSSVHTSKDNVKTDEDPNVSTNTEATNKIESLDVIAAREIIEDLKKVKNNEEESENFSVPLATNAPLGEKESTLDDYESIPIEKFGMAMLRGMGWTPGKGIGKNEQVVSAKQPVLRPKGLGLGADKVIKKEETNTSVNEPIKLVKGSFVRIIAGANKDSFGEIIGFDDETGRLIIKMALGNSVLTFNEFLVEPVSKDNYNKNSKVINVKKYEEYKKKEDEKEAKRYKNTVSSDDDSVKEVKHKRHSSPEVISDDDDKVRKHKEKKYIKDSTNKYSKYRSPSRDNSPDVHKSRKYDKYNSDKQSNTSPSPDRRKYIKSETHKSKKDDRNKYRNNRSSSRDSSVEQSRSKQYDKYYSHKSKSSRASDNSDRNSNEKFKSYSKQKHRKYSNSSSDASDSDESEKYSKTSKSKSKKHKEKKKSKRRSRSYSVEKKRKSRSPSPRKHKKSKKSHH